MNNLRLDNKTFCSLDLKQYRSTRLEAVSEKISLVDHVKVVELQRRYMYGTESVTSLRCHCLSGGLVGSLQGEQKDRQIQVKTSHKRIRKSDKRSRFLVHGDYVFFHPASTALHLTS